MHVRHMRYGVVLLIGIILVTLLGMTTYYLIYQARTASTIAVVQQAAEIERALQRIDELCEIIGIAHERSHIDFLVVSKFVGSQVGPLQLRFPEKWAGPYSEVNPTVQGKQFELIKTKRGCIIVPGVGVRLMNGRVIGKDLIFGPETDIEGVLAAEPALTFQGQPLVRAVPFAHLALPTPSVIVRQGEAS